MIGTHLLIYFHQADVVDRVGRGLWSDSFVDTEFERLTPYLQHPIYARLELRSTVKPTT